MVYWYRYTLMNNDCPRLSLYLSASVGLSVKENINFLSMILYDIVTGSKITF